MATHFKGLRLMVESSKTQIEKAPSADFLDRLPMAGTEEFQAVSTRWIDPPAYCAYEHALASQPPPAEPASRGFHPDRIAGDYRHHRHPGGHPVAGHGESQGPGHSHPVSEQPQTIWHCHQPVRRRIRQQNSDAKS